MVKFSCLYSHILSTKPKKTLEHSVENMHKTLADCFQNEAKSSQGDLLDECCSKSEGINNYSSQQDTWVHRSGKIRKSISLGSGLGREIRTSDGSDSENEKRENCDGTIALEGVEHLAISLSNQSLKALLSDSGNNESNHSTGDTHQLSKDDPDFSDHHFSHEGAGDSNDGTPVSPPSMVKSKSLLNICLSPKSLAPHSRSAEDLTALDLKRTEMDGCISYQEDVNMTKGVFDSYEHVGSANDWIVPKMDEVYADKHFYAESSSCTFEDMSSKDYKKKRIEDWVIDLQHCSPLEETNDDLPNVDDNQILVGAAILDNLTSAKFNAKLNPGVEVAKKYISSLSPASVTANLANHGLVVVPLLSAFGSLRTLNLSGNFIVKITAGALPRGLHVLNLSKNSITTIEGLRELTRLRILDLSYNRIVRIGHGLASCSSLKELYLAGNKISEVEGLHRLLKLNVLDLRFNKISTAKALGQLAANYNSLQAISLEGNPAQKNVGDENLKKYLQGLLPQLASFNRHSIKTKSLSDASDRSARMGITSNRGLRSDHKTLRKGNHGGSAHSKSLSSSVHGSRNQSALPKPSKGKPVRLPPTGSKAVPSHRNHLDDFGSKILGFGSDNFMKRSRSEGTLGAL